MKTIQTFFLTVLLLAAKTYTQEVAGEDQVIIVKNETEAVANDQPQSPLPGPTSPENVEDVSNQPEVSPINTNPQPLPETVSNENETSQIIPSPPQLLPAADSNQMEPVENITIPQTLPAVDANQTDVSTGENSPQQLPQVPPSQSVSPQIPPSPDSQIEEDLLVSFLIETIMEGSLADFEKKPAEETEQSEQEDNESEDQEVNSSSPTSQDSEVNSSSPINQSLVTASTQASVEQITTQLPETQPTAPPFNCTAVGNFAHPDNCSTYTSCSGIAPNLVAQDLTCPEGQAFSSILNRCSYDISSCGDGPMCLNSKTIADPNSNNTYYYCKLSSLGWHKFKITCGPNELYSSLAESCTPVGPPLTFEQWYNNQLITQSSLAAAKADYKEIKKTIKMAEKAEKERLKQEKKALKSLKKYMALIQPPPVGV